jgi:NADH:ubiquinone oxidoreductase subunit E
MVGGNEEALGMTTFRMDLLLCSGTGCHASGSLEVRDALKNELARHKLENEIRDH